MAFRDWQDTGNVEPLTLPIRDRDGTRREYTIPPLGYLDGIRLREEGARITATARLRQDDARIAAGEPGELDETERAAITADPPQLGNEAFLTMMLGGQLAQMREDNVPPAAIVHACAVAHTDAVTGREAAEKLWNEGPDPEALAAAMAAASITSPATPPPAHTSSTKKPASTRSTRSRSSGASPSRGTRSSTSRG